MKDLNPNYRDNPFRADNKKMIKYNLGRAFLLVLSTHYFLAPSLLYTNLKFRLLFYQLYWQVIAAIASNL